jgi:integral membrane protein
VDASVSGALTRYRIIAIVVSVGLVVLFGIGVPLNHLAHISIVSAIVGPLHGFLYMVFLVLTFDLARRLDWPYGRMLVVMLCGTIPVVSFVAEHVTTKRVRADIAARTEAAEHAATA